MLYTSAICHISYHIPNWVDKFIKKQLLLLCQYFDVLYTVSKKYPTFLAVTRPNIIWLSQFLAQTLLSDWAIKSYYFSIQLNSVPALSGKTQNHRNNIFTQMQYYCFPRLLAIAACFFSVLLTHNLISCCSIKLESL